MFTDLFMKFGPRLFKAKRSVAAKVEGLRRTGFLAKLNILAKTNKINRRSFIGVSVPIISALFRGQSGFSATTASSPDYVFTGGKVLTVDKDFRTVEAFAVFQDRIIAVGTDSEILALAAPNTQRIDLNGKMVMPGIIDSHLHPFAAAMYECDYEVPNMDTIPEVLEFFRNRVRKTPVRQWIGVQQVFLTRLKEKRLPTVAELDSVAPNHPLYMRTGPDALLNSCGLAVLGITADSGNHEGSGFGVIERDAKTKKPTGILRNCKIIPNFLTPDLKGISREKQLEQLKKLFAEYNKAGITSVADRNAQPGELGLYESLRDAGELTCRIYAFHAIGSGQTPDEIQRQVEAVSKHPLSKKDDFLWIGGVKMFLDGGMLTGSARMREPWGVSSIYNITDPAYKGLLFLTQDQMLRFASSAVQYGLQPAAHCVGDGALEMLANTYFEVFKEQGDRCRNIRPSICHGNFMYPEVFDLLEKSGAVVDMQPAWLYQDGAILRDHFGEERLRWFQPYRMLLDRKIPIGGGSDHMLKLTPERGINLYNPFLGIWTTLTRAPRWTDKPLHLEQVISREEAIRFYTIDSAFVLRSENDKGSIEPGKLADFIVLDRDLMKCPIDDITDTKVLETWLGGKKVHSSMPISV